MICPKCQYKRKASDDASVPDYECPQCGIIYKKYKKIEPKVEVEVVKKEKKPAPALVKILFLVPLWLLGAALCYFLIPFRTLLIYVLFILIFRWSLKNLKIEFDKNVKSMLIVIVLSVLFLPFYLSYQAVISQITGFSSVGVRINAIDAGYDNEVNYLAYLSDADKKRRTERAAIAKIKTELRKAENEARQENQKAAALAKKRKEEMCNKDLRCIGDKMTLTAGVKCPEHVERLAKYSYKWTDSMFSFKFTRYKWKGLNKDAITLIGDKIQFQNGFGALQNYIYFCDIDVASSHVIGVRASPGRL